MTETITNDVCITVATVNGSGSQSSNLILTRSLFSMGIPVGPKNLFPSNIQGLPTWFTVRANAQGYVAQRDVIDVLVAYNPATWHEDVAKVHDGGVIIYEESFSSAALEKAGDVVLYPVPFNKLAKQQIENEKLRKLLTNLIYVGVLAELLGMDVEVVTQEIHKFFRDKPKAVPLNVQALEIGINYAREHLTKQDPYRVESMDGTAGKIMIDGNTAAALGSICGGCSVLTWYPITPSSSLCESMISYFKQLRHDPQTGKANYAVVQAEDEIAAIGMVLGAGWAGARAMTSTSGPGVSLMGEFAGFSYYAEIPAVVWNIQRMGPSTGLPTRTAQSDITQGYFLSQGDTKHVCLFPASMAECFEFGQTSFDLAERLQTLVLVLSDLDLGMNPWMTDRFEFPSIPYDRGKVLDAEALEQVESFGRYRDVDGDGIPYRTLPGTPHPMAAYFTRGSGHDENARYTEDPEKFKAGLDRLSSKWETARELVPQPIIDEGDYGPASIGLIAYGSTDAAMGEARDWLAAEGVPTRYLRVRALPLTSSVEEFIETCDAVYVIEQNRDAQLAGIIRKKWPQLAAKLLTILHYDGMPVDAKAIVDPIVAVKDQRSRIHA